jgi:peptidoglycan/LPS O-acetylase OafA/YrhL
VTSVATRRVDPTAGGAGRGRAGGVPGGRSSNCFDALRLLAALSVVIGHASTHLKVGFLWYHAGSGQWFLDGVALFFILSGAMVYTSAEQCHGRGRPWREYLRNRFLRIAPAIYLYIVVITIFLVGAGVLGTALLGSRQGALWLASHLGLVPIYHPAALADFGVGVLNGSLWTIPTEVSFYLVVPVLVLLARRSFAVMMTIVGAVALASAVGYSLGDEHSMVIKLFGVSCLPWLGLFAIGMGMSRLWPALPKSWPPAVLALAAYVGCSALRELAGQGMWHLLTLLGGVPLGYLAFWVGHRGPALLRRCTDRIGDLSFGTYIWHMPLINIVLWWTGGRFPVPGTVLVLGVVAAALGCAWLSWRLVERPALRLKRYTSRDGSRDRDQRRP